MVHIPRRKRTGRMRRVAGETPSQPAVRLPIVCTRFEKGLAVCMTELVGVDLSACSKEGTPGTSAVVECGRLQVGCRVKGSAQPPQTAVHACMAKQYPHSTCEVSCFQQPNACSLHVHVVHRCRSHGQVRAVTDLHVFWAECWLQPSRGHELLLINAIQLSAVCQAHAAPAARGSAYDWLDFPELLQGCLSPSPALQVHQTAAALLPSVLVKSCQGLWHHHLTLPRRARKSFCSRAGSACG